MSSLIAWPLALISSAAFILLWFWEARRVLLGRRSMVESARTQLAACHKKAAGVRYDPELADVLSRSESIYHQAVDLYNETLHKPWLYLPGMLRGFRDATCDGDPGHTP